GWTEDPDNEKIWQRADNIPDTELWRTHERCRTQLVNFARKRLVAGLKERKAPGQDVERAERALDPEILTICFARRVATYKRAGLLFKEPDRLARILNHPDQPAQLILAGKAHPADNYGKELIRNILKLAREEPFRDRVVFIEDYDISVARQMVQGADVWLNNPRRPLEACGTSGMKASANGALNLSILDGWWDEGYRGDNGWAIGWGEEYDDQDYQDDIETHALYNLLEESVKPLFYERGLDDMPREWINMMKRSIRTICPIFNSHRMVSEYVEKCYVPLAKNAGRLQANNYAALKDLVSWKRLINGEWGNQRIIDVRVMDGDASLKGRSVEATAILEIAGLRADDLAVEIVHGPIDLWDNFKVRRVSRLRPVSPTPDGEGKVTFVGEIPLGDTGLYGYVLRVTPDHELLPQSGKFKLVQKG
ncbi:MAG: alpha-glucan family phosphorylase, partial [Pseudomonadota bacterium]